MKKQTIRFYMDSGIYKGWQYVKNTTLAEVQSWVRSGNVAKMGDITFTPKTQNSTLSVYFR